MRTNSAQRIVAVPGRVRQVGRLANETEDRSHFGAWAIVSGWRLGCVSGTVRELALEESTGKVSGATLES
mgnify:CR=1 FL=1